ncbi:hypothetical protein BJF95_04905 [Rhizobium oryziradicis]|uniref:Uncharacterized protein n=1 Tax=Rhizobium oryziradicis TaxID=1867956 RepID=A0A1Q8ZSF6_9HYPH|nr:hypothetical protein BJF95_04905 [Rhizobium oryziradicis]
MIYFEMKSYITFESGKDDSKAVFTAPRLFPSNGRMGWGEQVRETQFLQTTELKWAIRVVVKSYVRKQ